MEMYALGTGSDLKIKCLNCKNTYDVHDVSVVVSAVTDPDTDELVHYTVTFEETKSGFEVYVGDLLCGTTRVFSVFGQQTTDPANVFAIPCVVRTGRGTWITKPDSKKTHFAMRRLKDWA